MENSLKDKKDLMIKALKNIVVPKIKGGGFSGSFPHFRLEELDKFQFVSIQFNKYGGSFIIEFAYIRKNELSSLAKNAPFENLNYSFSKGKDRLRPRPENTGEDFWFDYSKFTDEKDFENLAKFAVSLLPQGQKFLSLA